MNGIGNAFIWAAIACGPVFLMLLGAAAVERKIAAARRHAPSRVAARSAKMARRDYGQRPD